MVKFMDQTNCNCIVCAKEFDCADLQNIALSKINVTCFKICQACLDSSDPIDDYNQVRNIINSYLNFSK